MISFGTRYDIDFKPRPGLELNIAKNWDVNNWITGNQDDGFKYDGCAAFQNVLDGKYRNHKKMSAFNFNFRNDTTVGCSIL